MLVDEVVGRRRYGALAAALIVLACALVVPAAARAELFIVDSTGDEADAIPGAGGCLTAGGKCTLRAAIEESNSLVEEEPDEIIFEGSVFDGGQSVASTITLGSSLPAIVDPARINGHECTTAAGVLGPCVGIDGPGSTKPALIVDNTDFVEIEGLAVTGAQTGIDVINGSEAFKALGSWFGVKLDGSAGGNSTGILLEPGSNEGRIGGEGAGAGNVFANNAGDGLDIFGASNVKVLGNYFGVKPDGATHAANGKDIEVTSTSSGKSASGNAIGTKVSSAGLATPKCDRGCNLISGAASSGIDLQGDGGLETPAVATTVAGNYIGLDATGTATVPNASTDVLVGKAAQTVIGGPKAGEANRINGGSAAVLAGPSAADLVVRGNLIGADSAGTGSLEPPDSGIAVNSEGLSSPAVEAVIVDNRIRMEGGVAIAQQGFGARISGNQISGGETGIKTFKSTGKHGNLIEGNSIEGLDVNGILVENNLNEILGNEISGAGGAGIWIRGSLPSGVTENLIGGDAAADENVIAGSGGNAVEITSVKATENEVARNRGSDNDGLFIDLIAAGAEAKGPNNGIEPPGILSPAEGSISGSGAEAGAKVRVFRKQSAEAGELESFLGETIADAGGNWKVDYGAAIPPGSIVAAAQTNKLGGTSELASATTLAAAGSTGGGGGGGGGAGTGPGAAAPTSSFVDRTPPRTKIVKTPRKRSRSSTARFEFESNELGSIFLCKLDDKPFDLCRSPKRYEGLKPGTHVFKVRAIDPAGHADSSPAKKTFTVLAES